VPAAILLNSDDQAFGHFHLDDASVKVFESHLTRVQSNIDKCVIIGQLFAMMQQFEYSATRFSNLIKQFQDETNQNILNVFNVDLIFTQDYLPIDQQAKFCKDVTDFYL
jgi:hypothetical protein